MGWQILGRNPYADLLTHYRTLLLQRFYHHGPHDESRSWLSLLPPKGSMDILSI